MKLGTQRLLHTTMGVVLLLPITSPGVSAEAGSQSGIYRPVEGQRKQTESQGQFPPVENRGNQRWSPSQTLPSPTLPATPTSGYGYGGYPQAGYGGYPQMGYGAHPQAGYGTLPPASYAAPPPPPAYDNGHNGYGLPIPNPGSFMNNFFGGREEDRPTGYLPPPVPPLAAPVAPVYNPPVPQPLPAVPPTPDQVTLPPPDQAPPHAQYLDQNGNKRLPQVQKQTKKSRKIQPPPAAPSPRPFSNPQETGNAFPLRASPQAGRSDPRFRPPELEGTP